MYYKALQIAKLAHAGQMDKGGNPYFLHPLAVSEKVETEDEKIVALLHDVIEDTDITLDYLLEQGFSEEILAAVNRLTKREGVSYEEYIDAVRKNPLALKVKIADMMHNSDLSRIPNPTEKDLKRIEKYKEKITLLKKYIN